MPQEYNEKMAKPLTGGLVRPKDKVTVYSTDKDPFHKDGEAFQVHRALAEKLIAAGKVTDKAPVKAEPKK